MTNNFHYDILKLSEIIALVQVILQGLGCIHDIYLFKQMRELLVIIMALHQSRKKIEGVPRMPMPQEEWIHEYFDSFYVPLAWVTIIGCDGLVYCA